MNNMRVRDNNELDDDSDGSEIGVTVMNSQMKGWLLSKDLITKHNKTGTT